MSQPSWAQHALFNGPHGVVTSADVTADAATRLSDQAREHMLSRPENVEQLASNVYVQRAMSGEAERLGMAQGLEAQAMLRLAREKALADLYWADFDKKHVPTDTDLEAYAQATYRATDDKALHAPERARVRHILFKEKTLEKRNLLTQLLEDVKKGGSFAKLAREQSEDDRSASAGGDVGFVSKGMVVGEFEQAVEALKNPGDLSGIVETQYGYHIIQLEERRPEGRRGFDEVREQLLARARSMLSREARSKEVQRLLEGAQANAQAIQAYSSQFKPAEGR